MARTSDGVGQRFGRHLRGLGVRLWLAYAPIIGLMAIYYGAAFLLLGDYDAAIPVDLVQAIYYIWFMVIGFAVTVALFGYVWLLRKSEESALVRIKRWFAQQPFTEIVLLRFFPVVLLILLFQEIYIAVKTEIPDILPFSWDIPLAHLDRLIFMGVDPWKLTHLLLPWPFATWAMNIAYILWFYLLMACFTAAAVMSLDSKLRLTFLLSSFLTWSIGGSLLAVIFSSAGPVYYERLFADPIFAPLFERLAAQNAIYPLFSVTAQDELWRAYADPAIPAIGISAFPSLHVCNAALMGVFGFRLGRPAGWFLSIFAAVIMVGSVHLGWHYAVDGIAGIALAFVSWRVAERFASWWLTRPTLWLESPGEACPADGSRHPAV